jgi:flagellar motor switch protein FliM
MPCSRASPGKSGRSRRAGRRFHGVRPYNLATQERIVRGRMPGLEIINDRFARLLRVGLFNFMHRSSAEVSDRSGEGIRSTANSPATCRCRRT